jgi:hypothetical protein
MDNKKDQIPIFPVAAWTINAVESLGVLLVRLDFLSHSMQKLEEAQIGRNYALTLKQVEALRNVLDRSIPIMKKFGPPQSEDQPH